MLNELNGVSLCFIACLIYTPDDCAECLLSSRFVVVHDVLGHNDLSLGLDACIAFEFFRLTASPVYGVGVAVHHAPDEFIAINHELSFAVVVIC